MDCTRDHYLSLIEDIRQQEAAREIEFHSIIRTLEDENAALELDLEEASDRRLRCEDALRAAQDKIADATLRLDDALQESIVLKLHLVQCLCWSESYGRSLIEDAQASAFQETQRLIPEHLRVVQGHAYSAFANEAEIKYGRPGALAPNDLSALLSVCMQKTEQLVCEEDSEWMLLLHHCDDAALECATEGVIASESLNCAWDVFWKGCLEEAQMAAKLLTPPNEDDSMLLYLCCTLDLPLVMDLLRKRNSPDDAIRLWNTLIVEPLRKTLNGRMSVPELCSLIGESAR